MHLLHFLFAIATAVVIGLGLACAIADPLSVRKYLGN